MRSSITTAVLSLAIPAIVEALPTDTACCDALSHESDLEGKVWGKENDAYQVRLTQYYSANAALAPWCMVLPDSTSDVSKIAKIISDNQCPFGIRSGAHSAWKGSNGVENGVTVDFGHMNTTTYHEASKIASIQPGSDWKRVFDTLDPYGVVTAGGRASVVGVGGFITGGGYSFHTNSRGFACDSVTNFEIVLADGSVINANAHDNSDLFKAQKGGSGNFGFVTRIDQAVIEQTEMWGGFVDYAQDDRNAVFDAYLNFADNMGSDLGSQNIMALYYDSAGYALRSILTNIDANERAPAFDEWFSIANTSSTTRLAHVAELVPEFTGPTPLGLYANWFAGMTTNDFSVLDTIDTMHKEYSEKMRAAAPDSEFNVLIQFQPVTQSIISHSAESGGNVLGLEPLVADGPLIMWLIAVTVDTAENQEKIQPLSIEFRDAINSKTDSQGTHVDWNYLNYSWKDQDPISTYGAESISAIKAAAGKFDPNGVFQKLRQSGFKIPA